MATLRESTKRALRALLELGLMEDVARMAGNTHRVLGSLVPLTFDPDPLIGWRAVEAMGVAARVIAERDADFVREHLRRLHWLLSEESGGTCWRAPEAMAEIVRQRPDRFGDYVPIVTTLLVEMAPEDLEPFRAGILWAIGRPGPLAADGLDDVLPAVVAALDHAEPQVRGMAVWCLGATGRTGLLSEWPALRHDGGIVMLYENGALHRTTVGRLVIRMRDGAAGTAVAS